MRPKIIEGQPMRRMSECRVRFGHCGRSFISPEIYKSTPAEIIAMSGSMFRASIHFHNSSTNAVHLPQLLLWVH